MFTLVYIYKRVKLIWSMQNPLFFSSLDTNNIELVWKYQRSHYFVLHLLQQAVPSIFSRWPNQSIP